MNICRCWATLERPPFIHSDHAEKLHKGPSCTQATKDWHQR